MNDPNFALGHWYQHDILGKYRVPRKTEVNETQSEMSPIYHSIFIHSTVDGLLFFRFFPLFFL